MKRIPGRFGFSLVIQPDVDPPNPRDDDNFGTLALWHKKYRLPNESDLRHEDYSNWSELAAAVEAEAGELGVVLPIYMYDHSGLYLSTGRFADRWDSGQVGFIYATAERIRNEFGNLCQKNLDKTVKLLENEIEVFGHYLNGDVWEYRILEKDGDFYDGCGGYFEYAACEQDGRAGLKHAEETWLKNLPAVVVAWNCNCGNFGFEAWKNANDYDPDTLRLTCGCVLRETNFHELNQDAVERAMFEQKVNLVGSPKK